ncbi:MAG: bifunctional proline dehydrogenase/L-glutamate gamma-semialdehyde dehydrogenase, partial [bacterium]
ATLDLLGEKAVSEKEAEVYRSRYLNLLDLYAREMAAWPSHSPGSGGGSPRVNLSVKLSSIYSRAKPVDEDGTVAALKDRLRPIMLKARDLGAFINLDVEMSQTKGFTLRTFQELMAEQELQGFDRAGVVIQAYLRDAEEDIEGFLSWSREMDRKFTVRLVKGAYWDYETILAEQNNWPCPVFQEKWETDASFERCCRLLLENHRIVRTAIASHNVRSIAAAIALQQKMRVPDSDVEFQMLYGMATPLKEALRGMGYPVRNYAPIGDLLQGMAYLVRRLLENTSNESFLRQRYHEGVDPAELLRPPAPKAAQAVPSPATSSRFRNAPKLDFTVPAHREGIAAAIEELEKRLPLDVAPVIGAERIESGALYQSLNPSHADRVVARVSMAGAGDVDAAVRLASRHAGDWAGRPVRERAAILRRAATLMDRRRYDLCALMVIETGKSWSEADLEAIEAIDFLNYYAAQMEDLDEPRLTQRLQGEENWYAYRPRGVGVVIAPWNFPLAISTGMTSAALVAGNSVVYKPAESSSATGWSMAELMHEAGVPREALIFLPGYGEEIGPPLVSHPDVSFVAFTGSMEVGLHIIESAGRTAPDQPMVKKVVAEMGGKNAVIVDSDADLDEAVRGIIESAFGYQGQKCSAASRVIVLADVHDRLVERLSDAVNALRAGPAEHPGTDIGPLIDREAMDKVRHYLEIGGEEGRLVVAPRDVPDDGYFVPPAVFVDVAPDARIAQEEIFGPVVVVIKARDFGKALEIANGTRYGLTGGIFSRSPVHIARAKAEFRVGNLYINRGITGAVVERQPFGGSRLSGVGAKAGGPDYLLQFLDPRTITENTTRQGFAPPSE